MGFDFRCHDKINTLSRIDSVIIEAHIFSSLLCFALLTYGKSGNVSCVRCSSTSYERARFTRRDVPHFVSCSSTFFCGPMGRREGRNQCWLGAVKAAAGVYSCADARYNMQPKAPREAVGDPQRSITNR